MRSVSTVAAGTVWCYTKDACCAKKQDRWRAELGVDEQLRLHILICLIDCTYSRGSPGSTADPGHPAFGCFAHGISRHSSATKALNAGQSLTKPMQYILLCHVHPFHRAAQSPHSRTFPRRLALVSFVVSRLVRKNRPDEICADRMSAITSYPAGIRAGVGEVARTCVVDLS